jgi:hypothetical protein
MQCLAKHLTAGSEQSCREAFNGLPWANRVNPGPIEEVVDGLRLSSESLGQASAVEGLEANRLRAQVVAGFLDRLHHSSGIELAADGEHELSGLSRPLVVSGRDEPPPRRHSK